jgi:hypothetical protein
MLEIEEGERAGRGAQAELDVEGVLRLDPARPAALADDAYDVVGRRRADDVAVRARLAQQLDGDGGQRTGRDRQLEGPVAQQPRVVRDGEDVVGLAALLADLVLARPQPQRAVLAAQEQRGDRAGTQRPILSSSRAR